MSGLARRFLLLSAFLWAFALLSPAVAPAWADIEGNCEATFKGVDIRGLDTSAGDAIDVDEDEVVEATFTSPAGFASHDVDLKILGISWNVASGTDDGGTSWTETVRIDDYNWATSGLYEVTGSATLSDGSTCSGAALINVTKNPLTTVAGAAAAATMAVGVGGVAASSVNTAVQGRRASRKIEDWVANEIESPGGGQQRSQSDLMSGFNATLDTLDLFGPLFSFCLLAALPGLILTGAAMATPEGGQPPPSGARLRRASWKPRITVVGMLGGLLGGLGAAVLLQQYGVSPLTPAQAVVGLLAGLAAGIIIPSLVHLWSVMRVNGKIADAEGRLMQGPAPGPGPQDSGDPPEPQS